MKRWRNSAHVVSPSSSEEIIFSYGIWCTIDGKASMAEALKKHMEQNVVLVDELNHSKPNDWLMPNLFANCFNIFPKDSKTYEPSINTLKGNLW